MAFSFNPGQSAVGGAPQGVGAAPGSVPVNPLGVQGLSTPVAAGAPAIPDSPFLFIQQRGRELTVNAYLQIVLVVLALLTIATAVTIFLYGTYLKTSLNSKKEDLAAKEATFKDYPFGEMKRLSDRVTGVDTLLKEYVSIRSPLKLLEDVVERQVVFTEFAITREKAGGYVANFTAVTSDYQSLIQQLEALKLTQYSKVAPSSKLEKFTEDKKQALKVKIVSPVFVQGVLPDDIVFIQTASTTKANEIVNSQTSTTSVTQ